MIRKILPLTKNKLKVLTQIYMYDELNLSTIAKNLNVDLQLIYRTINELKPILNVKKLEKIKLYSIKKEHINDFIPLIEKLRLEKSFGANIRIFDLIINSLDINKLYVFGSYAKNKQTLNSDIDLFLVSNEIKSDIENNIKNLNKKLHLKINCIIVNDIQFKKIKKDKNSNFHNILFIHKFERIKLYF